jgi:hypothetical protein
MNKSIFTATIFSAFLIAGGGYAQQSNQGTPNTLHGSGDMMQDGPHASSNPNADAETGMNENAKQEARLKVCEQKWKAAEANGTAGGETHDHFVDTCMSMM